MNTPVGGYRFAFGDEAGDLGFSFERGSSRYYVLLLYGTNEIEKMQMRVDKLRHDLHWPTSIEFRFTKTADKYRQSFLEAISLCSFLGYALIVDKQFLASKWHKLSNTSLYTHFFTDLIKQVPSNVFTDSKLSFDQFGTPAVTIRELRQSLKRNKILAFKEIHMKRSRGNNLLQCADMLAGSVFRSVNEQNDQFLNIVRSKITIWHFSNNENPPN